MTRDDILPTSIEVRHQDGHRGFAAPREPLQELADLLGPQRSREGLPYQDEAPDGNTEGAATRTKPGLASAQRHDGDRSQNWEMAIAALEDAPLVSARERSHLIVLPKSSEVRDNDRKQGFARLRDSLQELRVYLGH
jgi:hypothetical protein